MESSKFKISIKVSLTWVWENIGSKKIDFSIVEQKVDPLDIFVNMSDCDFKGLGSQIKSNPDSCLNKNNNYKIESCPKCKQNEKQYLKSEAKYLKIVDRFQQV